MSFPVQSELPQDGSVLPEHSADIRVGKDLLIATQPFAREVPSTSWKHVSTTFILLFVVLTCAGLAPWWPLQGILSLLGALLMVRTFITYHDYMHGAILQNSRLAWLMFHVYAAFALTPTRSWKKSHNYHHGHVGMINATSAGAFPLMTTEMWRAASKLERLKYRIERHPLSILAGYLTVFAFSICLLPLLRYPMQHWDSLLSISVHTGLIAALCWFASFNAAFFVVILPMTVACALGSYLFFAQHSFKRMHIISPEAWSFYRAAMESSSYMKLNKVMQWFTGNIGYHHIHHLNVRIPFYRLPEAMAAIPELQSPVTTSLAPKDIAECFKASLWDEHLQHMVSFQEVKSP
ncbi:fatty acid desaturase [Hahella sp. KA22]|uniref:fatty acid desaturase family protein n=1 Tax=Hahella sp. KA22 TaxID=1628392 RepID=UPI000FDD3E93|nr:fatty acid desaturase [Hahella sp. KA22]AZZ94869.1 fatty acid desaturase [Hahella sp. KA22]QAY58242.1 fatty acid desaturase [Hahella sp. KA22]